MQQRIVVDIILPLRFTKNQLVGSGVFSWFGFTFWFSLLVSPSCLELQNHKILDVSMKL